MWAASHLFFCTHRIYHSAFSSLWLAHTKCMRASCHLFDSTHRLYESGLSSVCKHTQHVIFRQVFFLIPHNGCVRSLCHLLDCTHRMYESWCHIFECTRRIYIRAVCHLFACRHRIYECVMLSVWPHENMFDSVKSSTSLHTQNVWEHYLICLTAHTECMTTI